MRATRKIIGVLLALMLVFGMSSSVFAANDCSITITNAQKDHTYELYQIFTGKVYEANGEAGLTNIAWGSSVKDDYATTSAKDKVNFINTAAKAAAFADELMTGNHLNDALQSKTAENDGQLAFTGLASGYYMIVDTSANVPDGDYKGYLLKVTTTNATVMVKNGVPEVQKKVKDTNDSTGETSNWIDSADYDIGDEVPFQLTANLANNVEAYTTYTVEFYDTLSAGLTYNNDAVVKIDGETVAADKVEVVHNGTALTFKIADAKAAGAENNSVVTVEYTATLNTGAVIGSDGNPNTVYLKYSNNPYSNTMGTTLEDKVIVFTYKTVVDKVDENGNPLAGAEFTLEKVNKDGSKTLIDVVKNDVGTKFTFTGLDDGNYILTETKAPDGYNDIPAIEFTIDATHDELADDPELLTLTGGDRFTGDVTTCTLTGEVENNKGSLLPSTGGMGTTILYLIGGLLILGAAGALVYRRRTAA